MAISDGPAGGGPMGDMQGSLLPNARSYPYLVQAGTKLKIASVQVNLVGTISGTGPKIKGNQADGFDVPATTLSLVSGDRYQATDIEIPTAFPADLTAFYDTFDIDWEVSLDGTTWTSVGTSNNQVYVSLRNSGPTRLFRTVVHLACSTNPGATNAPSAAANTWALFTDGSGGPANVKTWDGRTLYYYQPLTTFAQNPGTVRELLAVGRGQCIAWACMLRDAWIVNIDSTAIDYIKATPNGKEAFWVNEWGNPSATSPFWFHLTAYPYADMIPIPANPGGTAYGYYDDPNGGTNFLNKNTIKGQGTKGTDDAPSQKVFGNHQFLKFGGTYYDPSYGKQYSNETNFASGLFGSGSHVGVPSPYLKMSFSTTVTVTFAVWAPDDPVFPFPCSV